MKEWGEVARFALGLPAAGHGAGSLRTKAMIERAHDQAAERKPAKARKTA